VEMPVRDGGVVHIFCVANALSKVDRLET